MGLFTKKQIEIPPRIKVEMRTEVKSGQPGERIVIIRDDKMFGGSSQIETHEQLRMLIADLQEIEKLNFLPTVSEKKVSDKSL
jgi:hypothetical protein